MRRAGFVAFVVLLAGSVHAQELKGDLARLQGTWTAMLGPKKDVPITWVVKGDTMVSKLKTSEGKDVTTTCTIKLNETTEPKQFDQTKMKIDFGGDAGVMEAEDSPAIYELKDNEWKVCLVPFGEPRPKKFVSGELSDLIILRRVQDLKGK